MWVRFLNVYFCREDLKKKKEIVDEVGGVLGNFKVLGVKDSK